MAIIPIPFMKGQHEEVDGKMLPQGLFTSLQNVRYRKDARLGVRYAFRHDTANTQFAESTVLSVGRYDDQHAVIMRTRGGDDTPPQWSRHLGSLYDIPSGAAIDGAGTIGAVPLQQAGSLGVPTIQPIFDGSLSTDGHDIAASDGVAVGNYIYVAVSACDAFKAAATEPQWANATAFLYQLDAKYGTVVATTSVGSGTGASNVKVVTAGGFICAVYATTAGTINVDVLTTTGVFHQYSAVTLVTPGAGRAYYFDVAPGLAAGNFLLVYEDSGTTLKFGRVTVTGVTATFALDSTVAALTGPEIRPSICASGLNPTRDIVLVFADGATFITGALKYCVYNTSTLGFSTATTSITLPTGLGSVATISYPVVASSSLDDWTCAVNATWTINGNTIVGLLQSTNGQQLTSVAGLSVVSKPITIGTFITALATDTGGTATAPGSYYWIDNDNPAGLGLRVIAEGVCGAGRARAEFVTVTSFRYDPRRKIVATTAVGSEPGLSAVVAAIPLTRNRLGGWGLVRFESGKYAEQFQSARLNRQLFFSGSRILEYDGSEVMDAGLSTPTITSLAQAAGSGSIAAGTYSVVAVYEWTDALGYVHQSPPSLPVTIVVVAPATIITAVVTPNVATMRNAVSGSFTFSPATMNCRLYRTLAGGTVYQYAEGALNSLAGNFYGGFTVAMAVGDATVATETILYTQGARGGLSGILQNDIPYCARYLWAGSDRIITGCTDDPTQYQLSMLRFPGLPMRWSNTSAFLGNVDAPITGVAEMDGVYFVGTRDAIWTVNGQGPNDNGAGGSFSAPVRLPSDAGFYSAGSLVLTGDGILFQGAVDRIYLLPRGGGAPVWIGQPIRDTLALFPWITSAAYDENSAVVYFAAVDSAGATGRLLVYDTRIKEWSVDNVCNGRAIRSLSIFAGNLVVDGSIIETPGSYQDFDGSVSTTVVPIIVTGDIRPFGPNGYGRIRKSQVLGEARDVAIAWTLTQDVSYDSGKTFGETATWPVASLAVANGDAIDGAEHAFVLQRVDGVRLRWSWTTPTPTEGMVFHSFSLDVMPSDGLKRQASAMRAA